MQGPIDFVCDGSPFTTQMIRARWTYSSGLLCPCWLRFRKQRFRCSSEHLFEVPHTGVQFLFLTLSFFRRLPNGLFTSVWGIAEPLVDSLAMRPGSDFCDATPRSSASYNRRSSRCVFLFACFPLAGPLPPPETILAGGTDSEVPRNGLKQITSYLLDRLSPLAPLGLRLLPIAKGRALQFRIDPCCGDRLGR